MGERAFEALVREVAASVGVCLSEEDEEGERMLGVCELSLSSTMCCGFWQWRGGRLSRPRLFVIIHDRSGRFRAAGAVRASS